MAFGKSKTGEGGETIIAEGVKVEGDFVSNGHVTIEGCVSGHVQATGDVRIGARAVIDADVSAQNAFVAGTVKGTVHAQERAELTASSRVTGDISARVLSVEAGALLNGVVRMETEEKQKKHAQTDEPVA